MGKWWVRFPRVAQFVYNSCMDHISIQAFADEFAKIAGLLSSGLQLARKPATRMVQRGIKASGNPAADFVRLSAKKKIGRMLAPNVAAKRAQQPKRGLLSRLLN